MRFWLKQDALFCILYLDRFSWNTESIWLFWLFYSSMNSWYFPIVSVTKKHHSNGYANKFLVLQLLWRPVISIQPYFQKLLQKAQRTHMLIFVIKSPKNKSLNFEFDFNHWVLYVRLAKRTDFSIIDPKKTFFHPFQGIYCNYNEKIRQKCDLVIFFDWGVIWLIWLY